VLAALRRALHEEAFAAGDAFRSPTPQQQTHREAGAPPLHWSIILETTTTAHAQCIRSNPAREWSVDDSQDVTFTLDAGLFIPATIIVFKSVFFVSAGEPSIVWFERQPDLAIDPASRSFTITSLHPDTVLSISSMDRGQRKGAFADPPPSQPFPSPYSDSFADTAVETMPRYFSDHAGSWSSMPLRGAGADTNTTAFEQRVVAQPVGWDDDSDDSLYPFTIIGDWDQADQSVEADAYIYSIATYSPGGGSSGGDPVVSLVACNASDPGQTWNFNASASLALGGSIVDAQLGQCLDVDGCVGGAGAALWMWPCVTSGAGSDCNSTNQLWWYDAGAGWLISRMPTELCATASSAGADAALSVEPCGAAGALQAFNVDTSTGLVRLRVGGEMCLCSRRPGSGPNRDDSHAGIGLRLGGMTASSPVAKAYESTWYSYGYWFSLRVDGSWALTRGAGSAGDEAAGVLEDGAAAPRAEDRSTPLTRRQRRSSRRRAGQRGLGDSRIVLAQGSLGAGALQQWHRLRFSAAGATLTAEIDGAVVATVQDGAFPVGWAALTSGWQISQFANFSMTHSY
jgi:hypothetical protein